MANRLKGRDAKLRGLNPEGQGSPAAEVSISKNKSKENEIMAKKMKKALALVLVLCMCIGMMTTAFAASHTHGDGCYDADGNLICSGVAVIGDVAYDTLAEAVAAANAAGSAEIILITDIELGEKLKTTGDITISGEHTITRTTAGTMFEVAKDGTLTLGGGLTIDGNNTWIMDKDLYLSDLVSNNAVLIENAAKYFASETGLVSTAYMITTQGGSINLNEVTIQNNYSKDKGVVLVGGATEVNLDGATLAHLAATHGSGLIVFSEKAGTVINVYDGTVIDGNHVGGNYGLFKVYSGTTLNIYGGEITNTTGVNSNGTVAGGWTASSAVRNQINIYGGLIDGNSSVLGEKNGRNAAIYLHTNCDFFMSGGTISGNIGNWYFGGVDTNRTSNTQTITGGSIVDNKSAEHADAPWNDFYNGDSANTEISGGYYTQNLDSEWLADGYVCVLIGTSEGGNPLYIVTKLSDLLEGTEDNLTDIVDEETPLGDGPAIFDPNKVASIDGDPTELVTRAEVADMFYRLLNDETLAAYQTSENDYADVDADDWFNDAVSTMTNMGIMEGAPDGNFYPDEYVTRAQFAAILARFDYDPTVELGLFEDTIGHWAEPEVCMVADKDWMDGVDGKFNPDNDMTRGEVVAIMNHILGHN